MDETPAVIVTCVVQANSVEEVSAQATFPGVRVVPGLMQLVVLLP